MRTFATERVCFGLLINYHLADHLGSVRAVFAPTSTGHEIVERNDYYAFGKRHANSLLPAGDDERNRFLFNGKENQITGNLKFLDFGARMYDSEIARWFVPDPLGEDDSSISTYAYVANSPVNAVDPDGKKRCVS